MSELENAAKLLERRLPNRIGLQDFRARSALQQRCDQAATELRSMQTQIALSTEQTRDDVKRKIAEFIEVIATGNYGLLPGSATEVSAEPKIKGFERWAKTTVVALLPLGCLLGARFAGLTLSGAFNNWAIAAALLWATITMVSVIDPLYKSRIGDMREILSLFGDKEK